MSFRFLAPAEAELLEAISYYSSIKAELGLRFEYEVTIAVRGAVSHPERGAPRSKNTRRWLVKGFPYAVIYRESAEEVLVIAVAHERRKPGYWARRL